MRNVDFNENTSASYSTLGQDQMKCKTHRNQILRK